MIKKLVMLLLIGGLLSLVPVVTSFADDTNSAATMDQGVAKSDTPSIPNSLDRNEDWGGGN